MKRDNEIKSQDVCILYARVSGDDTHNDDRNLKGQIAMCKKYAQEHNYFILAEMAEDDRGRSGASFELEELNKIGKLARAGRFTVLVTREIDRLSRSLAKQLVVEEELKRCGVRVEYVIGDYPDTPEGVLNKNIRASIAEYEKEKIKERMQRGKVLKIQAGSTMTHGRPPLGFDEIYDEDKKIWRLKENKREADIVRMIFDMYLMDSAIGTHRIADELTKLHIPTYTDLRPEIHSGRKKELPPYTWASRSVYNILRNTVYKGAWRYGTSTKRRKNIEWHHEETDPVEVDQIIDIEKFEAAQQKLDSNQRNSWRNTKHFRLLKRRVYCGDCGDKLTHYMGAQKNNYYWKCKNAYGTNGQYPKKCSNKVIYVGRVLDKIVWEWLREIILNPEKLSVGIESYRGALDDDLAPLRDRLTVVDDFIKVNKEDRGQILYLAEKGIYNKNLDRLQERLKENEEALDALEMEKKELIARLSAVQIGESEIRNILSFAEGIRSNVELADNDPEKQQEILNLLDVAVSLNYIDNQRMARVRCKIGETITNVAKSIRDIDNKKDGTTGNNNAVGSGPS